MISKIFLILTLQIFFTPERTQIPDIYSFYVYEKTFIDPDEGPSKLMNGDQTQTISLSLKKDFSFVLTDKQTTIFSVYTTKMIGSWQLTSSNELQLNILSAENTFYLEGLEDAYKEFIDSPVSLKLKFSQSLLIYEKEKKLIPRGKLIKLNKKRMRKKYGEKNNKS